MKRIIKASIGVALVGLALSGCAGMETLSPLEHAMLDCHRIHGPQYDAGCVERLSSQYAAQDAEDRARADAFLLNMPRQQFQAVQFYPIQTNLQRNNFSCTTRQQFGQLVTDCR